MNHMMSPRLGEATITYIPWHRGQRRFNAKVKKNGNRVGVATATPISSTLGTGFCGSPGRLFV